ncbi:CocE/NonD family hydrolase [Lutimonas halocynthiae]|uniref:CocE/NonD family hydrolase n=1 Tax=Lutimonas halocynthiae TaxID=1446477 RepID=UPI0025B2EAFA|nr:CocE/NonD family hydrolase [Lutimonas halocynthiae]MDN3642942.1 CocE/NonD family hydrolase [Lutimonas halocynthiae]
MKKLFELLIIALINLTAVGQELKIEKAALTDTVVVALEMQDLASDYLQRSQTGDQEIEAFNRYMIEILAGDYEASIKTIQSLREDSDLNHGHPGYMPYELFSKAKITQLESAVTFNEAYRSVFKAYLENCNDEQAYSATIVFTTYDAVAQFTNAFEAEYGKITGSSIGADQALTLLKSYFLYHVNIQTEPLVFEVIEQDENNRYVINEQLIVSPRDGAELTVITARKRDTGPLPAVVLFTMYAESSNKRHALLAASKGYAGVVATARGKRLSASVIDPLKHEYKDVYAVIDWVSKQSWNNESIGMYGGSYDGFAQWASMKEKVHPALKTIIPMVSIAPGIDYPIENNIFYNFPYKWIPYVTSNKFLDKAANFDRDRWNTLEKTWFESGKAFQKMDSIEGTSRPLFQEWISHPSYDDYWQGMIPYQQEFAHINIPILTITGYYDDSQRGAMYYYAEHLKYNPNAEHYLLMGPYDHWTAQFASSAYLHGYEIDEAAALNIREGLAYEWFDFILKGKEKPALLKDKVNVQVMGANSWMHAPSLEALKNESRSFYLGMTLSEGQYPLQPEKPGKGTLSIEVDLADRTAMNNTDYYPWPILKDSINLHDGLVFVSDAFTEELVFNGSFSGELIVEINKKDFDFGVNLYELTAEGKYFHLSFYIGRASYAESNEHRKLLTPNTLTTILFDNTRIVSKKISKNSKIMIVVNGNKNASGQINYGTGKDVSSESINDADTPLVIKIQKGSRVVLPIYSGSF